MKIILGSQSQGRHRVLAKAGYVFDTMSADINEKAIRFEDPQKLTLALAHAKADALLIKIHEPALLITSDQVIMWQNRIREKPKNADEARAFLQSYALHPVETVTSIVVVNTQTRKRFEGVDRVTVSFRPIPEEVINQLIAEKHVFSCAGGFPIEDPLLSKYVHDIAGEKESVIGLPMSLTHHLLQQAQK